VSPIGNTARLVETPHKDELTPQSGRDSLYAMTLMNEIRRRLRYAVAPLIGMGAVVYFSYHIVQGDRGLIAWVHLKNEITKAEDTLSEVRAEKTELEKRVSLLRPDSLDPDMLEERARIMLNMGYPDERNLPAERL
jgi:cell division protein FtsB